LLVIPAGNLLLLSLVILTQSAAEGEESPHFDSVMQASLPLLTPSPMPPQAIPAPNKLYYGDNLSVLRDYIP
jgi:hypothetical protein